jgi:N-acetylglucosamine malate deacetylase 2
MPFDGKLGHIQIMASDHFFGGCDHPRAEPKRLQEWEHPQRPDYADALRPLSTDINPRLGDREPLGYRYQHYGVTSELRLVCIVNDRSVVSEQTKPFQVAEIGFNGRSNFNSDFEDNSHKEYDGRTMKTYFHVHTRESVGTFGCNSVREVGDMTIDAFVQTIQETGPIPDGVMIVAAHPDDEVIGVGGHLRQFETAVFVHVTDGAPRDMRDAHTLGLATRTQYAAMRRKELHAALAIGGIPHWRQFALDVVDQEAVAHLPEVAVRVRDLVRNLRPKWVVTHPYEGGHQDHDAAAFVCRAAIRMVQHEGGSAPSLIEFTSYHAGENGRITGEFLENAGREAPCACLALDDEQVRLKRALFECYKTQDSVLREFPIGVEKFRCAPEYDFTLPPHSGRLFYESLPWGITGAEWRQKAAMALAELRLC